MKIEVHQNRGEIEGLPSCDSPLGKKEGVQTFIHRGVFLAFPPQVCVG